MSVPPTRAFGVLRDRVTVGNVRVSVTHMFPHRKPGDTWRNFEMRRPIDVSFNDVHPPSMFLVTISVNDHPHGVEWCVRDRKSTWISFRSRPASPYHLDVTTLGPR